jgi:hypothetical protein
MNEKEIAADRFEEIMMEICSLVEEGYELVREHAPDDAASAEAYWYRQIPSIIDHDAAGILGGSMHEMINSLQSLRGEGGE